MLGNERYNFGVGQKISTKLATGGENIVWFEAAHFKTVRADAQSLDFIQVQSADGRSGGMPFYLLAGLVGEQLINTIINEQHSDRLIQGSGNQCGIKTFSGSQISEWGVALNEEQPHRLSPKGD